MIKLVRQKVQKKIRILSNILGLGLFLRIFSIKLQLSHYQNPMNFLEWDK